MEKICKIVYFDEESVTDYVQIVAGGELENTTELLKTREAQEEQNAQASAKVGISGVFKALLGWEASASADISGGLSFNSSKMDKNIVLDVYIDIDKMNSQGMNFSRIKSGFLNGFEVYKCRASYTLNGEFIIEDFQGVDYYA